MVTTRIRVGDELGARYTVGGVAGRGGVGVVHTAVDHRTGGAVLVTVPYARVRSALHPAGFAAALATATRVRHPGLVRLLDADVDDGTPYFVTGTVSGRSLAALLEEGALPLRRALAIGGGVATALAAAHDVGLVHRAIRPSVIAVAPAEHRDPGPAVAVLDLGVADLFRTPYFTLYPRVFGTAGYVSPEQIWNAAVGPATDVYALGLVLIEAITGAPVFPGATAEEAKLRVIAAAPIPTDLPAELRALLAAMTALEPADRPAAGDVAERLTALRHGPVTAPVAFVPAPVPVLRPFPAPPVRSARGVAAVTSALSRSGDAARVAAGRSVLTARVAVTARLRGLPVPAHVGRRIAIGSGGLVAAAAIVLAAALLPGAGSGVRAPLAEAAAVTPPTPAALAPVAAASDDPAATTLADRVTGARPVQTAALVPVAAAVTPVRTTPSPVPTPVPSDGPTAALPSLPTPSAIATTPPADTAPTAVPPTDTVPTNTAPSDTPPSDAPAAPPPVATAPAPSAPDPAAPQPSAPAATPPSDQPAAPPTQPSTAPSTAPSTVPTTDPSAAPPVLPTVLPSDAPTALPTGAPIGASPLDPSAIPVPLDSLLPTPGA